MDVKRRRIKVLVDTWGEIMLRSGEGLSRGGIVEILRENYKRSGVEPLRGAANPSDIYEKDLITLYVIGVEGLGIESEIPKPVLEQFEPERKYLRALEIIFSQEQEGLREKLVELFGHSLDSSTISKIFRAELIRYYYGFKQRDDMPKIISILSRKFPEEEKTFKRLTKFYIAIKVAEAIIRGDVRDWATKEALKQAIAVELGSPKALPDDGYISKIMQTVFGVKPSKYGKILRLDERNREKGQLE